MGRSQAAISTTLLLGAVFRLPLRRTEGFVRSIVDLMGRICRCRITPRCPAAANGGYHSGFHGPEILGAGEWARAPGMVKRSARGASFISRLTRPAARSGRMN